MVRIGNKEMPENKNIRVALSYIVGFGKKFGPTSPSRQILEELNISPFRKVHDLTSEQINLISQGIKKFTIEGELKEKVQKNISAHIRLGTYKGSRYSRSPNPLPARGQRTRHNARTAKGHKRITVANKKKAPTAK